MTSFTDIIIVYNPISTGPGKQNAEDFARDLRKQLPKTVNIEILATEYARHGEAIARERAATSPRCLVVSSSGDGGYHDVVNGVVKSGSKTAVTGVLPSGNANDHFNFLHTGDMIKKVLTGDTTQIDLLLIEATSNKKKLHRYAHSYIGIGVTPHIGKELNKTKLTPLTEAWIAMTRLFTSKPVRVEINGKTARYESLVFSNINRMSKFLSLSNKGSVTDGKFEVNGVRSSSMLSLFKYLIKASTVGVEENIQSREFHFICKQNLLIQLDGEIFQLETGTKCKITCEKQRLTCII